MLDNRKNEWLYSFFVKTSSTVSEVITEPCALDSTACNALGESFICGSFIVIYARSVTLFVYFFAEIG